MFELQGPFALIINYFAIVNCFQGYAFKLNAVSYSHQVTSKAYGSVGQTFVICFLLPIVHFAVGLCGFAVISL